jgi:hypothetical protein
MEEVLMKFKSFPDPAGYRESGVVSATHTLKIFTTPGLHVADRLALVASNGKRVVEFGLTPEQARELACLLIVQAHEIDEEAAKRKAKTA